MDTEKRSLDLKSSSGTQFPKLVAREAIEKEPPVASISVNKPNYKNPHLGPIFNWHCSLYLHSSNPSGGIFTNTFQTKKQENKKKKRFFSQNNNNGQTATAISRRSTKALGILGLRNSPPIIVSPTNILKKNQK